MSTIFVAGFVTDAGEGGFEWRTAHSELDELRQGWLRAGGRDVSAVVEIDTGQLGLESGDDSDEAITDALDRWPELWEPTYGQGRTGVARRALARARSWAGERVRSRAVPRRSSQ